MDKRHRDQQLADWLEGKLPEAEAGELLAELKADSAFREEAGKEMVVKRILSSKAVPEGDFTGQVLETLKEVNEDDLTGQVIIRLQKQRLRRKKWAWGIGIAALLVLALFLTFDPAAPRNDIRIIAAEGIGTLDTDAILEGREIQISTGLLELDLNSDARIVLEAPARFQVLSPVHVILHEGRCFAEMEKGKSGLRIETPSGEVLDLGTKFAIEVQSPEETRVHVFDGEVEVSGRRGKRRIQKGEGLAFRNSGDQKALVAAPEKFVSRIPRKATKPEHFVHWSFDEGEGRLVNAGKENGQGRGEMISPNESSGPAWVKGVFGQALDFSGEYEWIETDHPGVSGNRDRTVACWIKLPEDWGLRDRGPMIAWGSPDRKKVGQGWKLAVSRGSKAHPERTGRLDLTLGNRSVLGTTDLRDGRWHHVAAVALGGEGIPTFLLYVDGQLENVARNTIEVMETETEEEGAKMVRFGHQHYSDTRTLRGTLDEVYIIESALTGNQIRAIMRNKKIFGKDES